MDKDENMLCGPACINYILKSIFNLDVCIPNDMNWICDIASFLKVNTNLNFKLTCYNSNLYDDYFELDEKPDFDGFKSIENYLSLGEIIDTEKLFKYKISSMLYKNVIIACVSSSIFNNDDTMIGGHFIVLLENSEKNYVIANPKKHSIDIESIDKNHIINSINNFGNWIISIKR